MPMKLLRLISTLAMLVPGILLSPLTAMAA
jgi:hypothetical protein